MKIGADHRAIGRDSTLRPAIQRQERPVAIRSAGAPHMDFIPPDRHIERVGVRRDLRQSLVAGKHRLDPEVTKPERVAGRTLDTVRIIQLRSQHLVSAAQPHHHAATPQMCRDVDVPAMITKECQVGNGGFRPRQQNEIGICGNHITGLDQRHIHIRLAGKRVQIVEIGDAAQHRHGDADGRTVTGVTRLAPDIQNILGRQEPLLRKPGQNADALPARGPLDNGHAFGEQGGVAAKLVDQEPLDQRAIRLVENRIRPDKAGDDTAAVNVANHHHRHIGGDGEPHIGDITRAKIDLGRASRPFDDHQIGIAADNIETLQHAWQQFRLV